MELEEASGQEPMILPHWMAVTLPHWMAVILPHWTATILPHWMAVILPHWMAVQEHLKDHEPGNAKVSFLMTAHIMSLVCLRGLRPGNTQNSQRSYKDQLELWNFGYSKYRYYTASIGIILPRQRTTKTLIKLHRCAGWSAPLLFAYGINRFSHDEALIKLIHVPYNGMQKSPY